ncbi:MAG: LamG domain-containing protein [Verrucomicrobiota bacterium]|nr:LamG domain-containing protein [Verrucomicrobiota bacterium]
MIISDMTLFKISLKKSKNFSLTEILVVVGIVILLATMTIAVYDHIREKAVYTAWEGSKEQIDQDPSCLAHYVFDKKYSFTREKKKYNPSRTITYYQNLANYAGDLNSGWDKDRTRMEVIDDDGDGVFDECTYVEDGGRFPNMGGIHFNATDEGLRVRNRSLCPERMTLEVWVFMEETSDSQYFADRYYYDWPVRSGYRFYENGNRLCARVYYQKPDGSYGNKYLYTDSILDDLEDQWIHLAMTFDGTTIKLFVNGVVEKSVSYTPFVISGAGSDYIEIGDNYGGYMGEFLLFDRALSETEIFGHYDQGAPIDPTEL